MDRNKRHVPEISDEEEARIQAGIAQDPDGAEATEEELASMRPAREVLPPAFLEMIERERAKRRGRPPVDHPKKQVTLRLDADVIESFRSEGNGWQSRINDTLRKARGL